MATTPVSGPRHRGLSPDEPRRRRAVAELSGFVGAPRPDAAVGFQRERVRRPGGDGHDAGERRSVDVQDGTGLSRERAAVADLAKSVEPHPQRLRSARIANRTDCPLAAARTSETLLVSAFRTRRP